MLLLEQWYTIVCCFLFLVFFSPFQILICSMWVEVPGPALVWGCIGSRILEDISAQKIACLSTGEHLRRAAGST